MLQTMDEIKKADLPTTGVINGVDNANILSINSIDPVATKVDEVKPSEDGKEEVKKEVKEEVKEEKKEAKPPEEKKDEEVKPDDSAKKEEKKADPPKTETKDPVEKRIGTLTKKWRTAERERDYEKNKRLEVEKELRELKAKTPAGDKPKREDFEDEDKYIEALTDWKVESKLNAKLADTAKEVKEDEDKQVAAEIQEKVDEVTERGISKHDDYEEVVFVKDLALNQVMLDAILESDISEDILYFLGKNPDVSADIYKMKPLKAAKEIGKIEDRLVAESSKGPLKEEKKEEKKEDKKDEVKPVVKKTTNAPEPITPVKATGAITKDPSEMTPKEYRAWREGK